MLAVQQFIKEKGICALTNELGITVHDYEKFWKLSYSQIESPKFHPVVIESRGICLAKDDLQVLCRPFDRFFNYEEDPNHNVFDLNQAVVSEKIDGSLIMVWWNPFNLSWQAGTRNMAYAEGSTGLGNTFLAVVEKALNNSINEFMQDELRDYTYLYEVVSPETRIVTPYPIYDIYLLAIRSNLNGKYLTDDLLQSAADRLKIKRPKQYHFNSITALLETFHDLGAFDEGYVCSVRSTEGDLWHMKVKNPAYLAIAHLRNNGVITPKRIAKLVWLNEYDEYLSYFPEDMPYFEPYITAYWLGKAAVDMDWDAYKHLANDPKAFALAVKDFPTAGVLFEMRKGADNPYAWIEKTDENILKFLSKWLKDA